MHEENPSLAVNEILHARELINNAAQIDLSWDFVSSFFLFVFIHSYRLFISRARLQRKYYFLNIRFALILIVE